MLPAGTKLRTQHQCSPGGERHGKRKCLISLKGWERDGAPMGFSKHIDAISY